MILWSCFKFILILLMFDITFVRSPLLHVNLITHILILQIIVNYCILSYKITDIHGKTGWFKEIIKTTWVHLFCNINLGWNIIQGWCSLLIITPQLFKWALHTFCYAFSVIWSTDISWHFLVLAIWLSTLFLAIWWFRFMKIWHQAYILVLCNMQKITDKHNAELQRADPGTKVPGAVFPHTIAKMDFYYSHRFSWDKTH